jgi:subtilisin family serine protease
MRAHSSRRGLALHLPPAFRLIFLSLALCTGCSRGSMPLAPRTAARAPHPTSAFPAGDAGEKVVVTLAADADPGGLTQDGFTVLAGRASWRVAALLPEPGETTEDLLARLAGDPRFESAEVDAIFETAEARQQAFAFDDGLGSPEACTTQPAMAALGIEAAHQISTGSGVRVAILDTGAELDHPALAGRITAGYDFVDDDEDPGEVGNGVDDDGDGFVDEALGHGTHVAGIVSLVAPGAELLIARVLDDDGRGDMLTVARAIRWSVANGARVINLSLGGLQRSVAVEIALGEAAASGVVCVAAAGNWGGPEPQEYPATSGYTIAIAAVDATGSPAPFTSYGEHVDLSAPGVLTRSAYVHGGYALWSGTSMSTAWVSGAAALLMSRHPQWGINSVTNRLQNSAGDIVTLDPTLATYMGAGVLDVVRAFGDNDPGLLGGLP